MVSSSGSSTRVVQISNIAPQATKDQMHSLFGFLGKIEDIRLYPTVRDVSCPVASRICYVRFYDSSPALVAQHMTNTVFIDRALIVIPVHEIPDEHRALEMANNGTLVPGLNPPEPHLPAHVVNSLEGAPPNQILQTHDPKLIAAGLPPYPPLPATYDTRTIEEARRTILVLGVPEQVSSEQLIQHFTQAGEVKYMRYGQRENDTQRYALVEFTEQSSIIKGLQLHGSNINGNEIKVFHATQAITKPQAKSNEAAQREIEEAMCRVKEAQNLITAAIDPVIGLLSKDKRRTRSRSRSRRRSRSKSRRRSRSRHRSHRSRSRHRSRRSRSRHRHRSRSRSGHRSSRAKRSRSRSRHRSSRSKRDHSRDKDKKKSDKEKSKTPAKEDKKEDKEPHDVDTEKSEVQTKEEKKRSKSKERKKSRERTRSPVRRRSRSKDRKRSRSRDRKRTRSRDRKRTRSRERKRSRSRDRKRSRSRDRKRSRSRDRKRSRSRDRKRSRSRDRKRSSSRSRRSKSRSKVDKRTDKSPARSPLLAVPEERSPARRPPSDSSSKEKESPDNMDISNSP